MRLEAESVFFDDDKINENINEVNDTLSDSIFGETYYQYTTGGVTYDVWYDENTGTYKYIKPDDPEEIERTVSPSSLSKDSDGAYITVTRGGVRNDLDKIMGSIEIDEAEPSITLVADKDNPEASKLTITDERLEFSKNERVVAYIDSSEDDGMLDINNARIHESLVIGNLELFDYAGGIGIRRV